MQPKGAALYKRPPPTFRHKEARAVPERSGDYRKTKLRLRERQLTHREFVTVEYYMRGFEMKEAMKRAGYSETTAEKLAASVFRRPRVVREIERRRNARRQRENTIVERITEELGEIAFFNIGKLLRIQDDGTLVYDFEDATMEDFASIGEVTVESYYEGQGEDKVQVKRIKLKPYDKQAALNTLARIHGVMKDNLNLTLDGESLEDRLLKGRARVGKDAKDEPIEGEFEEVEDGEEGIT